MKNKLLSLLLLLPTVLLSQQMTKPLIAKENWLLMNPAALPDLLDPGGEQMNNYVQCTYNSAYYKSPDDPKHIALVYLNRPNWEWLNRHGTGPNGFVFGAQCTHTSIAGAAESNVALIAVKHLINRTNKNLLTLGISLGLRSVSENTNYLDFKEDNDPFDVGKYQAFSPNIGIGLYYYCHPPNATVPFFISASAQQVSGRYGLDAVRNISMVPHFYLGGGCMVGKIVQPMFWLSKAQQLTGKDKAASPLNADFTCRFRFSKNHIWFDVGYGSANVFRAGCGWKIKNYLLLGFAYDQARTNIFGPQTELTTAGFW